MSSNIRISFTAFFALFLFSSGVAAQKVWLDVGAKGGVGGNYLSEPDEPLAMGGVPFNDGAGGIGGGGGLFGEVRFLKQHLGLEVGFLFDGNKDWCSIDYSDTVELDYIIRHTSLRIPILLQAAMVKGITRIGIGIGPEIIAGLSASNDVEVASGEDFVTDAILDTARDSFSAKKRTDVALAWELNMAFAIKKVSITLDLRFAYNLTYPKEFDERVNLSTLEMEAGHTVDGRILLGAAYTIPFGE